MTDKVGAPFTKEQVININEFQFGPFHSFTCCSPEDVPECERRSGKSDGILLASEEGLICPCGKYKQTWVHAGMAEKHSWDPKDPFNIFGSNSDGSMEPINLFGEI